MALIDSTILNKVLTKIKSWVENNANASSASKLKTPRTLKLTGAVTDTSITFDGTGDKTATISNTYEGAATWNSGKYNRSGSLGPIAVAMSTDHNSNRFAYMNTNYILLEYSRDGGETWTEFENIEYKKRLTSTYDAKLYIGNTTSDITTDYKLRVTFTKADAYCVVKKIFINISSEGASGCTCKLEGLPNGTTTFTTFQTSGISGWSGWNEINRTFTFGNSSTSHYSKFRLTFSIGGVNSNNSYSSALCLMGICVIGDNSWLWPSNMARRNHLYSYDYNQNATFPNYLHAKNQLEIGSSDVMGIYNSGSLEQVILDGGSASGVGTATIPLLDEDVDPNDVDMFMTGGVYDPLEPIENNNDIELSE